MFKRFPNFKTTCLIVGISFILLSLSLFAKGLIESMAEFKLPESVLQSPHYFDAIMWVYVHMIVLGMLIVMLGIAVENPKKQKWIALALFIITVCYTFLDFRTSDSPLGNGLYKGQQSVAPAFISLLVNLLFLLTALKLFLQKQNNNNNQT